jgi:hypothetical protein
MVADAPLVVMLLMPTIASHSATWAAPLHTGEQHQPPATAAGAAFACTSCCSRSRTLCWQLLVGQERGVAGEVRPSVSRRCCCIRPSRNDALSSLSCRTTHRLFHKTHNVVCAESDWPSFLFGGGRQNHPASSMLAAL